MFINAHLRPVLCGFEPFVSSQAEVLQPGKGPVNMTNNGVNAWADFRDAASLASTPESCWDHPTDDYGENETIPPATVCHRYFQDPTYVFQPQKSSFSKNQSCHGFQNQNQSTGHRRLSTLPLYAEQMVAGLRVFDDQISPLTGQASQSWAQLSKCDGLARNANGGTLAKNQQYQSLGESCLTSVPSSSSLALAQPQPSYSSATPPILNESFNVHQTSPSTEYSSYSSSTSSSFRSSRSLGYEWTSIPARSETSAWWPQDSQSNINPYHLAYSLPLSHDGISKYDAVQPDLEVWNSDSSPSTSWDQHTAATRYISPQQYCSKKHWASSISSSSHDAFSSLSDAIEASHVDHSGREALSIWEPLGTRSSRQRRLLPDRPDGNVRTLPTLRSNDNDVSKARGKKRPATIRTEAVEETTSSYEDEDEEEDEEEDEWKLCKRPLKNIEPKPAEKHEKQSSGPSISTVLQPQERSAKDDFLVKAKLAGMSYKDIRRQGKFTEAESTLRGRFRTLTKAKNARVRKPGWSDNDIRLLEKAVRKLSHSSAGSRNRIPWKQVAEYISSHGGSYLFGNATCRKKWDEIQDGRK